MVGKTVLHYRIQNELGRGGMGVVYMAEDQRLNRIVALKFLPPDLQINPKMRSRLFQEAQAASALNHPNICVIHDIGEENGKQYIVMEYVDGQTMREILSMEAPIPEKRVVEICGKICEALAAAHTKGIIHRDIKPENVMISADGFVKIMDFGLAKLVENADTDASRLGHTGEDHSETAALGAGVFKSSLSAFQGTAWYMSPEQILKDKVDARSDQFSLGVMMYELLTGEQPFRGRDSVAVMKAIVQDEPPPPASINPEVSSELNHIVLRAIAKKPAERYADMSALRSALEESAASQNAHTDTKRWRSALGFFSLLAIAFMFLLLAFCERISTLLDGAPSSKAPDIKMFQVTQVTGHLSAPMFYHDDDEIVMSETVSTQKDTSIVLYKKNIITAERQNILRFPARDYYSIEGDFSPVDSTFVFSNTGRNTGIFVMAASDSTPRKLLDFGFHPKWSPDGTKIVFSTTDHLKVGKASAIHVYDFKKKTTETVSPKNGLNFTHPAWSPDGRLILCSGGLGSKWELWLIDLEAKNAYQISRENAWASFPAWGKDAETVYFTSNKNGGSDIWQANIDVKNARFSSEPVQLTSGQGVGFLEISPSKTKLVLTTSVSNVNVKTIPLPGSTGKSEDKPIATSISYPGIENIEISPDRTQCALEAHHTGKRSIVLASLADKSERILYQEQPAFAPNWSADGKWIAFDAGGADNADIYRVAVAGGKAEKLIDHPGADWLPTYSPDGKWLCFISNRGGQFDLWVHELQAGTTMQLTDTPAMETRGFWSPNGNRLAYFQIDDVQNIVALLIYDFTRQTHQTVRKFTSDELTTFSANNFQILTKICWSPDEQKLYYSLANNRLMEINLNGGNISQVYSDLEDPRISNVFDIANGLCYFLNGQLSLSVMIAELNLSGGVND